MADTLRVLNAWSKFSFRLRQEIVNVNRLSINDCSTANRASDKGLFDAEPRLSRAIVSPQSKHIPLDQSNHRIVGTAYARGIFSNRVQHRLDARRRTGDNAQDLARRSLLLQRLVQFLEQANVLDGDHCLIGEGFKELDLSRGEGAHLDPACGQRSNDLSPLTQGN